MECFRFCDAKHIERQLNGHLRFGLSTRYRLEELVYEEEWIGDTNEAVATTIVNLDLRSHDGNQRARDAIADFISVPSSASVRFENVAFERALEGYILSLSHGDFPRLEAAMCQSLARRNYDACFAVPSAEALVAAIEAAPYLDSVVANYFDVKSGPVTYIEEPRDAEFKGVASVDPFAKRATFRDQQEWRILLVPKHLPITEDYVSISVGDLGFSQVPVKTVKSTVAAPLPEKADALALIEAETTLPVFTADRREWRADNVDLLRAYFVLRDNRPSDLDALFLGGAPRSMIVRRLRRFLPPRPHPLGGRYPWPGL